MKKLSIILSVVLLLQTLCFTNVFATVTFESGDFAYSVTEGSTNVTVTGFSTSSTKSGAFTLPQTVDLGGTSYTVTKVGYAAFANQTAVTDFTMPDTVSEVGMNIFYGCTALKSVKLSASLAGIMHGTFYYCRALTTATIPQGVTYLRKTFVNCTALTSVTFEGTGNVPEDNGSPVVGVFDGCTKANLTVTAYKDSTAATYAKNKGITVNEIGTVTPSVFESGDFAYSVIDGTSNVTVTGFSTASSKNGAFTLPETVSYGGTSYTVTRVGYAAFANNTAVTNFIMPDTITEVGTNIFYGCSSLSEVHLSTAITNDGASNQLAGTFAGCTALKTVRIPSGIKCLPKTFINSGVKNVILTSKSTELPKGTNNMYAPFTDTTGVCIYYPSDAAVAGTFKDDISTYYFYDGDVAYSQSGDETVTALGAVPDVMFSGEVRLPAKVGNFSVTAIANEAFATTAYKDNTHITSFVMPDTVTAIGYSVFYGCSGLESVTFSKNITGALQSTFFNCRSLAQITIPEGITTLNRTFTGCSNLTFVNIATTVTTLTRGVFDGCGSLTAITVPSTVTALTDGDQIAGSIFTSACTLTVEAGSAAKTYAQTYSIPYALKSLFDISTNGNNAEITRVNYRLAGDYSVPAALSQNGADYQVVSIGADAFANQDILNILTIPDSITDIAESAFDGCTGDEFAVRIGSATAVYPQIKQLGISYIVDDATSKIAYKKDKNTYGLTVFGSANGMAISGALNITAFDGAEIVKIKERAFENQTGITEVTMDNTITDIGAFAFAGCLKLVNAQLSSGAVGMLDSTFYGCSSLDELSIPIGITALKNTYNGCISLVRVIIPSNIEAIYENAFANCTGLETVVIPNSVTEFDGWVGFKDETAAQAEYIATNSGKAWTDNPFKGATNEKLAICASKGSRAEEFAYSSGIKFLRLEDGDYSIEDITISNDNRLKVSVRDIYGKGNASVIYGLYNKDGVLSECKYDNTNFVKSIFDKEFILDNYSADAECRIYLWNDFTGLKPHCQAKSTKASDTVKILFLGNSITAHSPYEAVGWFGTSGMAATSVDKDYVHLVESYAKRINKNVEIHIASVWSLENGYTNISTVMQEANLQAAKAFNADIIIASFGENVRNNANEGSLGGDFNNDTAYSAAYYEASVRAFMAEGKDVPVISITSMMGNKAEVLDAKLQACAENNWDYIDFNRDEEYKEVKNNAYFLTPSQVEAGLENGVFKSDVPIATGVYVHPGNNGMRAMANRIWQYLEPIVEEKSFK